MADLSHLVYDWANHAVPEGDYLLIPHGRNIELDDETLRDGRQSPSLTKKAGIEERKKVLRLIDSLGINTADIGLPGAGPHEVEVVQALAQTKVEEHLKLGLNCAARTLEVDIRPIVDISQEVGIPIEACTFIGSSRMRQYVEGWTIEKLVEISRSAVRFAVGNNLPVMYVTEDTTRAHPEDIVMLYKAAIEEGAKRICICDTVGYATPRATYNVVRFVFQEVLKKYFKGEDIKVDFHGHRDRGLQLPNAIAALAAGVHRVHGCANGMGERSGNLEMELIIGYLVQEGYLKNDLTRLKEYCDTARETFGFQVERSQPLVGEDAFSTATGVHAAAIAKGVKTGDVYKGGPLADAVYSGAPAHLFGRHQKILLGEMSGRANAAAMSQQLIGSVNDNLVGELLGAAKQSGGILPHTRVLEIARPYMTELPKP